MRAFLRRHRRCAIDTNVFIYSLDPNPRYFELANEVFTWVQSPGHQAITSTVTMTELLVKPYLDEAQSRVDAIYALLSTFPNLQWIAPDLAIADLAAQFRAQHRLRTPDALQAATAARSGATGFIANDPVFRRIDAFEALLLDDLL